VDKIELLSVKIPCHASGGYSPACHHRSPEKSHWSVRVGFVVDKVAVEEVLLLDLRFPLPLSLHQFLILISL
jgi:hypothetical protein